MHSRIVALAAGLALVAGCAGATKETRHADGSTSKSTYYAGQPPVAPPVVLVNGVPVDQPKPAGPPAQLVAQVATIDVFNPDGTPAREVEVAALDHDDRYTHGRTDAAGHLQLWFYPGPDGGVPDVPTWKFSRDGSAWLDVPSPRLHRADAAAGYRATLFLSPFPKKEEGR